MGLGGGSAIVGRSDLPWMQNLRTYKPLLRAIKQGQRNTNIIVTFAIMINIIIMTNSLMMITMKIVMLFYYCNCHSRNYHSSEAGCHASSLQQISIETSGSILMHLPKRHMKSPLLLSHKKKKNLLRLVQPQTLNPEPLEHSPG